jgi:hypothetical protein
LYDREAFLCDRDGNPIQINGSIHAGMATNSPLRYEGKPVEWKNHDQLNHSPAASPCTCSMTTLMNSGCSCGHIQRGQWGIR